MAKLKVWGGLVVNWKRATERNGQVRTIIATTNQKAAAAALGMSLHEFRGYWTETGNAAEIEIATSRPGVIFQATSPHDKDFAPWPG